ncbi:response regulator transcription factor [Neomoorella humiferrea]|uniref:Stage 0 sporulation protein A homolog n=1 Tax=Neomoorella humiferrea TaxID=676965 RepID=A0A2T0AWE6_9FIRM|nr:response regulator transcription factor [Moorella humiferrea]PRR75045.1 Oxygen regulatory protein NreC [Moorella humiferrea]
MEQIRIVLADDHPIYRSGLHAALDVEPDFNVIGEAGDLSQLIATVEQLQPDILLLDVILGNENSLRILDFLHEVAPRMRIVILTAFADRDIIITAIKSGVHGFIIKEAGRIEIAAAIRCVYQNKAYLDPRVTGIVFKFINNFICKHNQEARNTGDGEQLLKSEKLLSKREKEIFLLARRGLKNKEIATHLHISAHTVHNHLLNIYRKLGISNRHQLMMIANDHE